MSKTTIATTALYGAVGAAHRLAKLRNDEECLLHADGRQETVEAEPLRFVGDTYPLSCFLDLVCHGLLRKAVLDSYADGLDKSMTTEPSDCAQRR